MSDFLLELSKNPQARRFVKQLGLPIPMPQVLARPRSPREEAPLADRDVAVFTAAGSKLALPISTALARAGAHARFAAPAQVVDDLREPGEAYGRVPSRLDLDQLEDQRFHALVFDASTLETPADLGAVQAFFQPLMRRLRRCGRIVFVGRPVDATKSADAAAARHALTGLVRSVGKEIGKAGSTANLIVVDNGAEDRIEGPLRFLAGDRSTYVDAQVLRVSKRVRAPKASSLAAPLAGKTALVTGAARGIGAATARVLAAEGAHVLCLDRPDDAGPASQLAREIGGSVVGVDITSPDAARAIADAAPRGLDVVVHNAGITRDKTLRNMKREAWDLTIDVNLGAVTRLTQALLDGETINAGARIVCLSSIAGIAGNMGQTNYAAAKAGVIGFVRHMAPSLGKRNITINAIAPGFIETRMTATIPVAIREVARRMNSLGQGGQPSDVGEAITFFALPNSHGLTAQTLRVCGQSLVGA